MGSVKVILIKLSKMANYNPWLGAAALQSVGEEHRGDGSKSSQGANAVISRSRAPTGVEEINSGLKILLPVDSRGKALHHFRTA